MMRLKTLLTFGFVLAAGLAQAQTTDTPPVFEGTPRVIVTDGSGKETTGRLIRWTDSAIVLNTGGVERTFSPGEARRVDLRGDSLRNGFLIGAAFGWFGGVIADCPNGSQRCPKTRVAFTILGMATWGAIGAGIDALIPGRSPLWRAQP
jgi:hypothetical protein